MGTSIPTNTGPPVVLPYVVNSGLSGVDLTTVTGATFNVRRPDGSTVQWTGTIQSGATTGSLTALYAFNAGDVSVAGTYTIQLVLNVPGGTLPVTPPAQLVVTSQFSS